MLEASAVLTVKSGRHSLRAIDEIIGVTAERGCSRGEGVGCEVPGHAIYPLTIWCRSVVVLDGEASAIPIAPDALLKSALRWLEDHRRAIATLEGSSITMTFGFVPAPGEPLDLMLPTALVAQFGGFGIDLAMRVHAG